MTEESDISIPSSSASAQGVPDSEHVPSAKEIEEQRQRTREARRAFDDVIEASEVPPLSSRISKRLVHVPLEMCCSGVYFLFREDVVVYIGQSNNVIVRVSQHLDEARRWPSASYSKNFDRASFIRIPVADLLEVETALIRFFLPEYNGLPHGALGSVERDEKILAGLGLPGFDPAVARFYNERAKLSRMNKAREVARRARFYP